MNRIDTPGERLLRWEKGESPGPWYVSLFPTNRCNLKCSICWQRRVEIDHTGELSDERLLHFVDECAALGAKEWVIVGGGEPMIRDELVIEMCERICSHGMNGRIQTNGLRFKPDYFERLINIQWSEIVFSLDGPTEAINDEIRSKGSFAHATANMRKLNELRIQKKSTFPRTYLTSVVTSTNYDKFDQLAELAHELGCAGLRGGHLTPESDLSVQFELNDKEMSAFPDHIRNAGQRAESLGLNHGLYELLLKSDDLSSSENSERESQDKKTGLDRSPCLEPWLSIQIQPTGYLGPCCIFWDTEADNIQDMTLEEAWLGPYMQKVRAEFLEGRYQSYCASCHSWFRVHDAFFREDLDMARERDRWVYGSVFTRLSVLMRKSWQSLRRNGLRSTVKRGIEWLKIYRRK